MHIQPIQPRPIERQEIRVKEARIERDSEKLRLERLLSAVRTKLRASEESLES
jgi:hypothetical protein